MPTKPFGLDDEPLWDLPTPIADLDFAAIEHLLMASAKADVDCHAALAAKLFGVPLDQVTIAQWRAARAINYGVVYGYLQKGGKL